ncbi:DUF6481 family protein [Bosea sp. BH3]|uniref:DUF6481 family protein n=1 Tax=Bosea sp. BH3 TaxID=2871701 RepID=UPI0021CB77C5|nr:DUF6481 family protein [Bosea sp. BH3]MCU4178102.1 DUF6481 family protein [Bosea sp. BH3]
MNVSPQSFPDRRAASAHDRKALLERFKARPRLDDPAVIECRAEREALASVRSRREFEKAGIRAEAQRPAAVEQARVLAERHLQKLAREAALKAGQARTEAERMRQVRLESARYMQMRSSRKKS